MPHAKFRVHKVVLGVNQIAFSSFNISSHTHPHKRRDGALWFNVCIVCGTKSGKRRCLVLRVVSNHCKSTGIRFLFRPISPPLPKGTWYIKNAHGYCGWSLPPGGVSVRPLVGAAGTAWARSPVVTGHIWEQIPIFVLKCLKASGNAFSPALFSKITGYLGRSFHYNVLYPNFSGHLGRPYHNRVLGSQMSQEKGNPLPPQNVVFPKHCGTTTQPRRYISAVFSFFRAWYL